MGWGLKMVLALKVFEMTTQHNEAISRYFREQYTSTELPAGQVQRITFKEGMNLHQKPV